MTENTAMVGGETRKLRESKQSSASEELSQIDMSDNKLSGVTAISALEYAARKYNERSDGKFRAVVQNIPEYNSEFEIGEKQPARLELSKTNRYNSETVLVSDVVDPSNQNYSLEFEYQENGISNEKRKLEAWYTEYISRFSD